MVGWVTYGGGHRYPPSSKNLNKLTIDTPHTHRYPYYGYDEEG